MELQNNQNLNIVEKKKGRKKKDISIDDMIIGLTQHISELKEEYHIISQEIAESEIKLSELYNLKNNPPAEEPQPKEVKKVVKRVKKVASL